MVNEYLIVEFGSRIKELRKAQEVSQEKEGVLFLLDNHTGFSKLKEDIYNLFI